MRHTARLTMACLLVPLLSLLCMPIPGSSSDAKGNDVALGFGLESCQTFRQARSNGLNFRPVSSAPKSSEQFGWPDSRSIEKRV